jgi:hypothetical protein
MMPLPDGRLRENASFFMHFLLLDRLLGACEHTCALVLGSREMGIQSSRRGHICVQRRRRGIYLRFICARLDRRRWRAQKRSDMLAGYYLPSKQALSQIGKLSLMCAGLHFELEACTGNCSSCSQPCLIFK